MKITFNILCHLPERRSKRVEEYTDEKGRGFDVRFTYTCCVLSFVKHRQNVYAARLFTWNNLVLQQELPHLITYNKPNGAKPDNNFY